MPEFIAFVSANTNRTEDNRNDFVEFARNRLKTFGADLPFDASRWDVTEDFRRRGTVSKDYLIFHQHGHGRSRETDPIGEPLASFAKAYIRYASSQKMPESPPHREVTMFRVVDAALRELGHKPDVGLLDAATCNRAVALMRRHYKDQTGVLIGACMERLVRFLRTQRMTNRLHARWKHGIKVNRKRGRASAEADEARNNKLPSKAALEAIPKAYLLATEPRHVITTSALALLLCAPERVNEIVGLSTSCDVDEFIDGKPVFGLRWTGSKGHPDHVKYIPTIMVDLAREAVERLRRCSAEARALALWYEENPRKLWLPPECAHLRGCDLTLEDICRIVGFRGVSGALAFCDRMGVERHGRRPGKTKKVNVYRFSDVERAFVSKLPANFPIADPRSGLKYSDALFVCHYGCFNDGTSWRCMIEPVKLTSLYHQIQKNADGRANMFDRLGLATADDPISLTSHQLRHYLNTIALSAGLSGIDVSAWSGRADRRQNDAYDHETSDSILETARAVANARSGARSASGDVGHRVPHSDAEPTTWSAIINARAHGHATEYGFCEHDFAAAPCSMFMACLNCMKHICIKGANPGQLARLERSLEMATQSLDRAREARLADYEGGAEWVEAHEQTVERLRQLVGFLNDPDVPSGAVIRLAKSGRYNLVEQALRDRNSPTDLGRVLPAQHEPARISGPSL